MMVTLNLSVLACHHDWDSVRTQILNLVAYS
jgi:hypothetical protein